MVRQPRKAEVTFRGGKAVAQARAVDEELEVIFLAHIIYICNLFGCIDAAKLRGEGDIDHTRNDHVLERRVGMKGFEPGFEVACTHLAIVRG